MNREYSVGPKIFLELWKNLGPLHGAGHASGINFRNKIQILGSLAGKNFRPLRGAKRPGEAKTFSLSRSASCSLLMHHLYTIYALYIRTESAVLGGYPSTIDEKF